MRISGRRIQRTRLVHTDRYVVAVDVELVIPDDDPTEPCYEAETVQFLQQVEQHAQRGDDPCGRGVCVGFADLRFAWLLLIEEMNGDKFGNATGS